MPVSGVFLNVFGDGDHINEIDARNTVGYNNGNLSGSLDLPAPADVRSGTQYDSTTKTGTLAVPTPGRVIDGVATDATVGTFIYPTTEKVLLDYQYGAGGTEFTGTLDPGAGGVVPSANDVRAGVAVGAGTGNLVVPTESTVVLNTLYDSPASQKTGNVRVPPESKVETGYAYGPNDALTGLLQPFIGTIPAVTDVRSGVNYGENDALLGVLESPVPSQVLVGVGYGAYGTEFEGTLTDLPGGTGVILPPVNADGSLRSPLVIGDDYTGDRAFQWQISPITGINPANATTTFRGWKTCCGCCPTTYDWEQSGTVTDNTTSWDLKFDLLSDVTNLIEAGEYEWSVTIEEGGTTITITGSFEHHSVYWIC